MIGACNPMVCPIHVFRLLDAVVDFLPGPLQRPAVVLKKTGAAAAARRRGRGQQAAHQEETLELTPSAKESMCTVPSTLFFLRKNHFHFHFHLTPSPAPRGML